MAKLTVDGVEVEVPNGASVIQACEAAGKEIPRFCYHERLSVAGNCRMCLVEVEKAPKPVASCAYPVADGMVVHTDSKMVREARRGVMEFLLVNHPLDCPICDQGGECDLQDQAYGYGRDSSRFAENKRAVKDKYLGPLVKTTMTRCIQCTRCVRFASEVAGVPELGATSRGEGMEIGTYVEKALTSELSGNLIDICPVGALTSLPYAYVVRPWELKRVDSIDVFDATGTNISLNARGNEVLRVLPRTNDDVNEEWMADKGRFAVDGLKWRRLDQPWVRRSGALHPASWADAFAVIAERMNAAVPERIGAIAGDLCDAESMLALKLLMQNIGSSNVDCRQDGAKLSGDRRDHYVFNTGIAGIEEADALLLIGCDPRHEAPIINARFRKRAMMSGSFPVGVIGPHSDLTYKSEHLSDWPTALHGLLDETSAFFGKLRDAQRPMIVVGQAALRRNDGAAILNAAWRLADKVGALGLDWHGFNVLHSAASRVGGLDLGLLPGPSGQDSQAMLNGGVDLLWLLGADECDLSRLAKDCFVVYQGHHGDRGAARADVILPGAAYSEKDGTYVNTEGRVQRAYRITAPPGDAREDWKILRAFSDVIGKSLSFSTLDQVRQGLEAANPVFKQIGHLARLAATDRSAPQGEGPIDDSPMVAAMPAYYQTDTISRASPTMAECTKVYVRGEGLYAISNEQAAD